MKPFLVALIISTAMFALCACSKTLPEQDVSPLAHLTGLEILDLGYNNITDASPLSGLPESIDLRLDGNPAAA
ncbi:MAG: hypothetical protein LBJ84_03065 [Oscillospiraceae bacterium]|nr:hypothetical protein [Oscillospiraceae bacterium]